MKTNTIKIALSNEVIDAAETLAQLMGVTPHQLLSYLLEGWTNPRSNLRKRFSSAVEVGPTSKRKASNVRTH